MVGVVQDQRDFFQSGAGRGLSGRLERLTRLEVWLRESENDLLAALEADLGKNRYEAVSSEIGLVLGEIRHARRHLKGWMGRSRRSVPVMAWPGRARVTREPWGCCLVLAPWNYPVQLALAPVVGLLAGGNVGVVKMSEHAPQTSKVLAGSVGRHFPPCELAVLEGGPQLAEALLAEPFDHIFYTGSSRVGRKVMAAAAERLIPVTLELGGKCPAVVDAGVERHLETVARRIVWGKFMNSGQTCVAPDHVWVQHSLHDALVAAMVRSVGELFPDGIGRMVNRAHFERVQGYFAEGSVAVGGGSSGAELTIEPTILTDVSPDSRVMDEEVFGPVLPVLKFGDLDEPLQWLGQRGDPLAVYVFSDSRQTIERVRSGTRSGGICVNDTILQITGHDLPFGGVGESGMGRYHGKAGFDCFTWERSELRRSLWLDPGFRYPPMRIPFDLFRKALDRFL